MVTFRLNKLVRDNYIKIYEQAGQKTVHRLLNQSELKKALLRKLAEEVGELSENEEKLIEELADIEQVLNDIKAVYGLDSGSVEAAKQAKLVRKGGFQKGVYVETLTLNDGDGWVAYYRSKPEHFIEIKR